MKHLRFVASLPKAARFGILADPGTAPRRTSSNLSPTSTAKALGLTIPETLFATADEGIQ
jgi:hypothetical protein